MKNSFILFLSFCLFSCTVPENMEGPISNTGPILTNTSYKFNGNTSTYSLTITGTGYNLTLNETPWGNLSGYILSNNITSGNIPGMPFTNIATGSSNNTRYFLWIVKL
jgi:hypothetical protein